MTDIFMEFKPATLAREEIVSYLNSGEGLAIPGALHSAYRNKAAVFVSIKKQGQLRGCIGTVQPRQQNLAAEIIVNARSAAFSDPRFPPLRREELVEIAFSVDVLGAKEPVSREADLDSARYGIFIRSGMRSGLLLPDLEGVDTVSDQLNIARQKAGIAQSEKIEIFRFTVERYHQ